MDSGMKGHEPISVVELCAMQQRADAASKGPWRSFIEDRDHHTCGDDFIQVSDDEREDDMYVSRGTKPAADADLDFIAAASQDVPRLIAEVKRLRDEQVRKPS
jgi:hypothetical protein